MSPSIPPAHTVLLLHGACLNGRMWDIARDHLEPVFHCLTPDLPGHGWHRQGPFQLESAIDALLELVKDVPSLSVVGESLGGYTAMALAPRLGTRLKALVLSGASSNFFGLAYLPWWLQTTTARAMRKLLGEAAFGRAVVRKLEQQLPPRLCAAVLSGKLQVDAFDEAVAQLRAHDFADDVARTKAPILFVNGSRDRRQVRQEPAVRARAIRAETSRFHGAVHGVSLWQAERLAEVAREFIARHVTPAAPADPALAAA